MHFAQRKRAKKMDIKGKDQHTLQTETLFSEMEFSLSHYSMEWLNLNRRSIKEATYIKYYTIIEKYINPQLGSYPISSIDSFTLEKFTSNLLEKISPETTKTVLVLTNTILSYIKNHTREKTGNITIVYPKTRRKEMRVLSQTEQNRFVQYLLKDMDCCKFGIMLALLSGIRIGELCALKWKDIDFHTKTMHIRSTMQRLKNLEQDSVHKTKIHIGSPKTETSYSTIPLTEVVVNMCENFKTSDSNTYILTGGCNYMEPRTLQYRLTKYLKECELEGVHFHTLRHTFATRCVEVGFELKSLSEILGHANTNITLNQYVHSSLELKRTNMNKLSIL